ncbi:hypothetical protein [Pseudomonas sp. Teo4]|uniref:hypothetical protein n=1 Tax=Pseudomonas sp. Teo4 TaxID=3064528 RepID=UPI002AB9E2CF|nr:hypothetical protein [Pseudomonas sp. Teo4]MDZ3991962.1 hypothetical protein [Pseudomonas sp. Teo4]
MRQLTGFAMSALVIAAVAFAFAPRQPAPLAVTQILADRVQVNALLSTDDRLIAVGERGRCSAARTAGAPGMPARWARGVRPP